MYLDILKRDLKRKRTINVILLIFIIMATTFISASANNLLTIATALDDYFDVAEIADVTVIMLGGQDDEALDNLITDSKNAKNYSYENCLFCANGDLQNGAGGDLVFKNTGIINAFGNKQKYFDENNNEITELKDGEIYLQYKMSADNDIKIGDPLTFVDGSKKVTLKFKGYVKDALLGSTMMGTMRFLVSTNDFEKLAENTTYSLGRLCYADSDEPTKLVNEINASGVSTIITAGRDLVKMSYIFDMVVAGILMVVSVCIILISLVILRFTIMFTLSEEVREIGVMKAIGIKNRKIRGLYIIKYFAIAVVGAAAGFGAGIPLGKLFLKTVSDNMVLVGGENILPNLIFAVVVIAIVVMFSYLCTRHIKKLAPITAIRNGSDGERYKRKGALSLSKSHLGTAFFLAVNDILSHLRKYVALVVIFTLGVLLIIIPINSMNTLKSGHLVTWFSCVESDMYVSDDSESMKILKMRDRDKVNAYLDDMENLLNDNGIPAEVMLEVGQKVKLSYGENFGMPLAIQGNGVGDDEYDYIEGSAPLLENEIAVSFKVAEYLGADIGDTVELTVDGVTEKVIITGKTQFGDNFGDAIRVSTMNNAFPYVNLTSILAPQVRYTDSPSDAEREERIQTIEKLYPDAEVMTCGEYADRLTGGVSETMGGIRLLIVALVIAINVLVSVLMVKTFITKERSEIALMKSIGIGNGVLIRIQMFRISIVMIVSALLAILLSYPLSEVTTQNIFRMMGAYRIEFEIVPFEVFVFYPLLVLIFTGAASALTALGVRKIKTSEINND